MNPVAHNRGVPQNGAGVDAVALDIKLLGTPSVSVDGDARRPRGLKVWALLAYLVVSKNGATRIHLADLLFDEADDPARALRWNLTQLRHLLGADVVGAGDPVTLAIPPGASVDVTAVAGRGWLPTTMDGLGRDLLEGMSFPGCPAFEAWLVNQRRYLVSCGADVLREASVTALAAGEVDRAIESAVHLVALDPLDESAQALLIRCYAVAGDENAATRQLEACRRLLDSELGVEPSDAVVSAVHASPATVVRSPAGGVRAIRAQIEAGRAASQAGALDAGVECFRRAAAEAHSLGDVELRLESLLALGSALTHAGVDRHQEASAALHGAVNAARRLGRGDAAAEAQMELAWMEFLRARYERARVWIEAALADAPDDGRIRCIGLWIRGKCAVETGNYAASVADLTEAVELVAQLEDLMRRSYCLASLGRTYVLMEEFAAARPLLEEALAISSSQGFAWFTPVPACFLGDLEIAEGNFERAEELLEEARATARAVDDPSIEAQSMRGLALLCEARGQTDEAIALLMDARERLITFPDWEWILAHTLDALARVTSSVNHPTAERWLQELEVVAGRADMKELVTRAYIYRAPLGDSDAWDVATVLGAQVDNPALHRLLANRPVAAR